MWSPLDGGDVNVTLLTKHKVSKSRHSATTVQCKHCVVRDGRDKNTVSTHR